MHGDDSPLTLRHETAGRLVSRPQALGSDRRVFFAVEGQTRRDIEAQREACREGSWTPGAGAGDAFAVSLPLISDGAPIPFSGDGVLCLELPAAAVRGREIATYSLLAKQDACAQCWDAWAKKYQPGMAPYDDMLEAYHRVNGALAEFTGLVFRFSPLVGLRDPHRLLEHVAEWRSRIQRDSGLARTLTSDLRRLLEGRTERNVIAATLDLITALERFQRELDELGKTIAKDDDDAKARFYADESTNMLKAFAYRASFHGEIVLGPGREQVVFDTDGRFTGNATAERFRLLNTEFIYFYVQTKATEARRFSVETSTQVVADETFDTAAAATFKSLKERPFNDERRADYLLVRLTHGRRFPASSELQVKLSSTDAAGKESEVITSHLRVLGSYSWSVNTGLAVSFVKQKTFVAGKTVSAAGSEPAADPTTAPTTGAQREIETQERNVLFPVLTVTRHLKPRAYNDVGRYRTEHLIPSIFAGFRIDDPRKDWFAGVSVEPLRGLQLMFGINRGLRSQLSGGDQLEGATVSETSKIVTKENFETGPFFGFAFDLNLFAQSLLSLGS